MQTTEINHLFFLKTIYLSALFAYAFLSADAQFDKNVENHQVQIGLPMPSILYEKGISKNTTLSIEAITGLWIRGCSDCQTDFGVYPILRGQYRYYYNMRRRLDKKKNISGNSGNYISALLAHQSGNPIIGNLENASNTLIVGPVYGIQRTYRRGFFYRLEGGIAYIEEDFASGIGPILAARIGWVILKRRLR